MNKPWSNFNNIRSDGTGKKPLSELPYYREKDGVPEQKCHGCSKWLPIKGNYSTGQRTPLRVDRNCLKCKSRDRRARYASSRPYSPAEVYAEYEKGQDIETLALYFHTGKPQISRMIHAHERELRKAKITAAKDVCGGAMRKSQIALTDGMWCAIDDAVIDHHYPSRSEFIRQAVREKLSRQA